MVCWLFFVSWISTELFFFTTFFYRFLIFRIFLGNLFLNWGSFCFGLENTPKKRLSFLDSISLNTIFLPIYSIQGSKCSNGYRLTLYPLRLLTKYCSVCLLQIFVLVFFDFELLLFLSLLSMPHSLFTCFPYPHAFLHLLHFSLALHLHFTSSSLWFRFRYKSLNPFFLSFGWLAGTEGNFSSSTIESMSSTIWGRSFRMKSFGIPK